jgi:hypothetical protein
MQRRQHYQHQPHLPYVFNDQGVFVIPAAAAVKPKPKKLSRDVVSSFLLLALVLMFFGGYAAFWTLWVLVGIFALLKLASVA